VLSVAEYERLAADAEWNGKMPEAVKLWERARDLGSRPAAKRLYQIFSFGAGGVEADYVKAIEAAQVAQKLGLEVPPLPRK
jgi:TPR repeat protein